MADYCLQTHSVVLKASNDTYVKNDGEVRYRFQAVRVMQPSLHEENQMLLKRLKMYGEMGMAN